METTPSNSPDSHDATDALDEQALYSLVRRETRDADEQAACLRDWDQVYEQLSPGQFEGRFMEIRFRGIQLFREVTNQSVHEEGLMRAGERVLGVPVALQGQGYFCGRPITPDAIMTMRGGEALEFSAPEHFDIVAVSFPVDALTRYAQSQRHAVGTAVFPRVGGSAADAAKACARSTNPNAAQLQFLASGGPQQDPLGMDPDGDGFVCGWTPATQLASQL